jgi:hypothetical protein
MEKGKIFDLEDRLVEFAVKISALAESLPATLSTGQSNCFGEMDYSKQNIQRC